MKTLLLRFFPAFLIICLGGSCANIVPPSGGKKDTAPPTLLSVTPPDSQLHARPKKIELRFDEYIVLNNPAAEIVISPLLPAPHTVILANKKVTVLIPDTLLTDSTTYRISFGKAIQDLHENNPFSGYQYYFSTGDYFDSLSIAGMVTEAATGLPDSAAYILLYNAAASDSAVVSQKPLYVGHTDGTGSFRIDGLPPRAFRIYALQDNNTNLMYDGGSERIAFHEAILHPQPDSALYVALRTFREKEDTSLLVKEEQKRLRTRRDTVARVPAKAQDIDLSYQVLADTGNAQRRTQDITRPLLVVVNKKIADVNADRISLSYDSSGAEAEAPLTVTVDTGATSDTLRLQTVWKQDAVYTLRLLRGFVSDTGGTGAMPSRYRFRTKWEDDYGKLHIHLPAKYLGPDYILQVTHDKDTIWHQPATDTMIHLTYLQPGGYTLCLIADENGNGQWDTGDLFAKLQPEIVIPYRPGIQLKPGWEHVIDFEEGKRE